LLCAVLRASINLSKGRKDMNLESIRAASNGFIIVDDRLNEYVAKTLIEAAQIVGEIVPDTQGTRYALGMTPGDLSVARACFRDGKKIEAIKILRDCFTPRLGLREAKDMIEILCG
jgi:ribosomal protein L7/L12